MTNSYDEIIPRFLEAPDEAYGTAVKDQDFVALAVAGILDPEIGGPRAAKRFDALSKARGPDDVIAELVLGILEHADRISDELIESARQYAREHSADLPVTEKTADRITALVTDQAQPDVRRLSLLIWLWHSTDRRPATRPRTYSRTPRNPTGAPFARASSSSGPLRTKKP